MVITSINNEKVKYWTKLKDKKYRDIEKKFIIEGDHLVNIALEKNLVIDLISLNDEFIFKNKFIVNENIMRKISNQKTISSVAAVCSFLDEADIESNVLLIDELQDPGNLGTIIRSAVAFNFKTIILGNNTVDLYNDKVIRASEGMIFNVNFIKKDLITSIDELKKKDYKIIGTDVESGNNINEVLSSKLALIIGNEGKGINESIIDNCDYLVNIPMNKVCESLNAGVAASILMYEVYK